ncbi:FKBP12-interacting protein of 37 [Musa troglodytarum]|uniref:FKBP12-interacting protein of 37 n=1 Tax=Musa troglodytarum TaxID=320322 RepID=A0A9E7G536_9LILI|nr:FKBP12-interacting protein of 37 [Musa troglodytarum]
MASDLHLDDEDDFGGDVPGSQSSAKRSGGKRTFGDLDEEEDDVFGPKKGKPKVEESGPGMTTGMILSLRESLQNCKDNLATCQEELEASKSEIQKWHSAFQNGPATPAGTSPEPGLVLTYLQNLKSSEESLKEQLEKAKKKEAAFIVTFAKKEQEIADLKSAVRDLKTQLRPPSMQTRKLLLDPAIHEEFTRLKNLVEEKEKKIKELQDNLAAVNFTASSKLGKMLMAKCRTLQEENEEIGAMASEGKIHELGMKIVVLKSQNAELRNQFDALYKHMEGTTNEMERSNEMAYILQERLEAKDCELRNLKELLTQKEAAEERDDDDGDKEEANEGNSADVEA